MGCKFNKDEIRDLLIDAVHSKNEAKKFFERNLDEFELLKVLTEIAIDDYSGDARMKASYYISQFPTNLLFKVEKDLLILQSCEWDSVSVHALVALGKIKSNEGLKCLINRIESKKLYWEVKALEHYLSDLLK